VSISISNEPLVSAIIPCFNSAATLGRAIESVRRQTYRHIEIIAIDDGSRDETPALLRAEAVRGVIVITQANGGVPVARNSGIAAARGEFVAFLDSDDEWHPHKTARQVQLLCANPEMLMAGCWVESTLPDNTRRKVNADREPPQGREAWRVMLRHSFYNPTGLIVRTAAARKIGGFVTNLLGGHEDQDFCIRIALEGEVGFIDEVLATMYERPVSLSRIHFSREHETVLPMILDHCRTLAPRLSRSELRTILGARYMQIGRNVYASSPRVGFRLLAKAIGYGAEPAANLWYLLSASPWSRRAKHFLRRQTTPHTPGT
jgi:glycosyltransferase involved in cell wall biosynthesis